MNIYYKLALGFSYFVLVWLAVRAIKRFRAPSLLAIHVLLVSTIFDTTALFVENVIANIPDFAPTFDPLVERRILCALILCNVLGFIFLFGLNKVLLSRSRLLSDYHTRSFVAPMHPIVLFSGCGVIFLGLLIYFKSGQTHTILSNVKDVLGDYSSYYMFRYEISQAQTSGLTRYAIVLSLYIMLPILTLTTLQRAILLRSKELYLIWFALISVWIVSSLLLLQKSPVLVAIFSNLIGGVAFMGLRGFRLRRFILPSVAAVALLLLLADGLYRILGASSGIESSLYLLYQRVFEVPMVTMYYHFDVFPDLHPYTHFSLSRTLNLLLGFGQTVDTAGMAPWEIASYQATGIVFNMNTGIVGACWAEMGYVGVAEGILILYGLCFLWDFLMLRNGNKGLHWILAAYFLGRFFNVHNSELMFLLISGGLVIAPAFLMMLFSKIDGSHEKRSAEEQLPTSHRAMSASPCDI